MKKLLYLFLLFIIISCTNSKKTYWCGDHPCINKKEREAYFKETFIIEIREFDKTTDKNKSEVLKIMKQAKVEEKKRIKNEKHLAKQKRLEEKKKIKEEKELAKQAKLDKKKRIKEQKELAKQAKFDKKKRIKEENELAKQVALDERKIIKKEKKRSKQNAIMASNSENVKINPNKFNELTERIIKKNAIRPYPDINATPN